MIVKTAKFVLKLKAMQYNFIALFKPMSSFTLVAVRFSQMLQIIHLFTYLQVLTLS